MKRLRRGTSIAGAVTLLLLAAPVGSAAAAREDAPASQQGGQGDERRADAAERALRKRPVEPQGNPASPAAMRAGRLSCGDVITKNTTLTADVGPCAGDGIVIGADNIRLNLNGRRVLGNTDQGASGEFAGIRLVGRTGVTITGHPGGQRSGRTGTISGFEAGVVIDGGSANTVENLTVRDNIGIDDPFNAELGDGIIIFDSPANRILNNIVIHNGIFDGIGVLGSTSDNTTIQSNTVEDTVGPSDGGAAGQGIIVNGADGMSRDLITGTNTAGNVVRRSASGGISNINNSDATVVGNIVEDNGLTNNAGNGIGVQAGFGFQGAATRVVVQDNQVRRNGQNGIEIVRGARENRIINNVTADNNRVPPSNGRYFDLRDGNDRCDANVWNGNVWSAAGLYSPICVTNGGSGPLIPPEPEGTGLNPHMSPTCGDDFDNDEDGLVDGRDPDCNPPDDPEGPPGDPSCSDGIDNDGDFLIDDEDYNCGVVVGPGAPGPGDGPGGPGPGPGDGPGGPGPGQPVIGP